MEINADPQRLDLDWRLVDEAVRRGVVISIGADAHNTSGMSNMDLGIGIARKGGLSANQVLMIVAASPASLASTTKGPPR